MLLSASLVAACLLLIARPLSAQLMALQVTTLAGSSSSCCVNGVGTLASFGRVTSILRATSQAYFVFDEGVSKIRMIDKMTGVVSTFSGVQPLSSYSCVDGAATAAAFGTCTSVAAFNVL